MTAVERPPTPSNNRHEKKRSSNTAATTTTTEGNDGSDIITTTNTATSPNIISSIAASNVETTRNHGIMTKDILETDVVDDGDDGENNCLDLDQEESLPLCDGTTYSIFDGHRDSISESSPWAQYIFDGDSDDYDSDIEAEEDQLESQKWGDCVQK